MKAHTRGFKGDQHKGNIGINNQRGNVNDELISGDVRNTRREGNKGGVPDDDTSFGGEKVSSMKREMAAKGLGGYRW